MILTLQNIVIDGPTDQFVASVYNEDLLYDLRISKRFACHDS